MINFYTYTLILYATELLRNWQKKDCQIFADLIYVVDPLLYHQIQIW